MNRFSHCLYSWGGALAVCLAAAGPVWADEPAAEPSTVEQSPSEAPTVKPSETEASDPEPSAAKDAAPSAPAEEAAKPSANPGLDDLDRATQLKVTAEGLGDLNEVIDRLELALDKGLDEENTAFAHELLIATLLQRATTLSAAVLGRQLADPRQDPRWIQVRQFALTDLQRAISIDDQLWEAYLLIGRLQALPLGDPHAARRAFTKVIDAPSASDEERASAYALRGAVQRDDEERLADFSRAIELDPKSPEYRRLRAQHYSANEEFEKGLTDIDAALALEPDDAASHELRGMILLGLERYDEALESFDRATELAPEAALPYQHRAELYRRQGDMNQAAQQLTKALELSPGNVPTLLIRASVYFDLGKPDLSIADVEEVIRRQPQLLQAHLMRAELYAATDRMDQAIEQLERLVKIAPGQAQLLEQLGTYLLVDGRPHEAIDVLTQLIEVDSDNFKALVRRGDAYLSVGKHAEAVADFNRALELDDQNEGLLNNLAWVLATSPIDDVRDGKRATELSLKACELSAYQMPHILSTLAASYAETGDFESAIKWSEKAVELGKDDPTQTQLSQELASYKAGKPWREMQQIEDSNGAKSSGDDTFAPPSAVRAPARTADF